jgi:hypothetical protein
MMFSSLVSARLMVWENRHEDYRFVEFGQAMANAIKILDGRKKPRMNDPRWFDFRQQTVRELKSMLRQFRIFAQSQSRPVNEKVFVAWVTDYIRKEAESLPYITHNMDSLLGFIQSESSSALHLTVGTPKPSPSQFFYEWFGFAMGREPEQLRQEISRLGSRSRR